MTEKVTYPGKGIHEFLEGLAREAPPLPVGGCAIALAGSMSAALEIFVAQLMMKRKHDPDAREGVSSILSDLEHFQES